MQDTSIYIIINLTSIIDHSDHGLTLPQAKLVAVESFPEGMIIQVYNRFSVPSCMVDSFRCSF